jgi:hypothetical protein
MVPLSERRHRLYESEIPEVIRGLRIRLEHLLDVKSEPEKAKIAFHVLYRLIIKEKGRPKYPKFSWEVLERFLEWYEEELM